MEVVDTLQHNDSLNDVFEREPFSVLVRSTREGIIIAQRKMATVKPFLINPLTPVVSKSYLVSP